MDMILALLLCTVLFLALISLCVGLAKLAGWLHRKF